MHYTSSYNSKNDNEVITAHLWCSGHSTSIDTYRVWGARDRVQVSRREFHTHIHLDYVGVEILSCIKNK